MAFFLIVWGYAGDMQSTLALAVLVALGYSTTSTHGHGMLNVHRKDGANLCLTGMNHVNITTNNKQAWVTSPGPVGTMRWPISRSSITSST